jgi:hypothetical protein
MLLIGEICVFERVWAEGRKERKGRGEIYTYVDGEQLVLFKADIQSTA